MAGVRGNFAGLEQLADAISRVGDPAVRARIHMRMGAAGMKQLNDSFRQSRDPYGRAWAPLKLRKGKPLLDTGRMRASAAMRPVPGGFEIVMTAAYASTHQRGHAAIRPVRARLLSWQVRGGRRYFAKQVSIPRRQMLPEPETGGLGPYWTRALSNALERAASDHFQGRL